MGLMGIKESKIKGGFRSGMCHKLFNGSSLCVVLPETYRTRDRKGRVSFTTVSVL